MSGPIQKLIAAHAKIVEGNPYAYFELAYTRQTEWMAWICSEPRETNPNRIVIASGSGSTPEVACEEALNSIKAE
jgi:hypothetical protein